MQNDKPVTTEFIQAYDGNDMAGYLMEKGIKLSSEPGDEIKSITNILNTAIIVTKYYIYRARPHYRIGFCIERLVAL